MSANLVQKSMKAKSGKIAVERLWIGDELGECVRDLAYGREFKYISTSNERNNKATIRIY